MCMSHCVLTVFILSISSSTAMFFQLAIMGGIYLEFDIARQKQIELCCRKSCEWLLCYMDLDYEHCDVINSFLLFIHF